MSETDNIYEKLLATTNLNSFLDSTKLVSKNDLFFNFLYECMDSKGKSPKDLIRHTQLSKSYIYKLLSGQRSVSRDSLLQIAFAIELNLDETNLLLKYANLSELYSRDERDCVIIFALLHNHSLTDLDEILYSYNLTPLKKIL